MTEQNNPLQGLLIDEEEISKHADEILGRLLAPYIRIVKSSNEVQFMPAARSLGVQGKILVTLAARLVAKRLKLIDNESMSQKELITMLSEEGVAEGSVKSSLNKLRSSKMLSATSDSKYYIGLDKLAKLETALGVKPDGQG